MSQKKDILEYLQAGNYITALDALNRFGCFRLASRISELKKDHPIRVMMLTLANGKQVASYWLYRGN